MGAGTALGCGDFWCCRLRTHAGWLTKITVATGTSSLNGRWPLNRSVPPRLSTVRGCVVWRLPMVACTQSSATTDKVVNASPIHHQAGEHQPWT
jgi:hypothetical protein